MKLAKIIYITVITCALILISTGLYIFMQPEEKYFDFTIEIKTVGAIMVNIPIMYDLETNETIEYVYSKMVINGSASIEPTVTDHGLSLNITGSGNVTMHAHRKDPPYLYYPFSMQERGRKVTTGSINYWIFCNSSGQDLKFSQKMFATQVNYNYISNMGGELIDGWQLIKGQGSAIIHN